MNSVEIESLRTEYTKAVIAGNWAEAHKIGFTLAFVKTAPSET